MQPPGKLTPGEAGSDPIFARIVRDLNGYLPLTLHALADRLDDLGLDRLAFAFHWLAIENRFPCWVPSRFCWWGWSKTHLVRSFLLPRCIMQEMKARRPEAGRQWNSAPTLFEAFWIAADAYAYVELPPPDGRWTVPSPPGPR